MSVTPTQKREAPRPRPKAPVIELSTSRPRLDTPAPSSGFNAVIEGASLADLVQLECMRGLTRAVTVKAQGEVGTLYFDQGQLVHAVCGSKLGEEAALTILGWQTGSVEPSSHVWLNEATIFLSWQGLLMTAAQRQDELTRDQDEPPSRIESHNSFDSHSRVPASEKESSQLTAIDEFNDPTVVRAVRLDSEGEVLSSRGDVDGFSDAAAYAVRLAQLIGDGLGLENFQGMECVTQTKVMLSYVEDETLVALEALSSADLATYRKRAGT